jgi:hypothetical protein
VSVSEPGIPASSERPVVTLDFVIAQVEEFLG